MENKIINETSNKSNVIKNPWSVLREYTDARIGLGRSGVSLPTSHLLEFQLAHAQAQDAVHLPLDVDYIFEQINNTSFNVNIVTSNRTNKELLQKGHKAILLHSEAKDRIEYLQRPDLGRKLNQKSHNILKDTVSVETRPYDLAIVIVDGLSSLAIKENAINFIDKLCQALSQDKQEWSIAPFTVVQQGRVAIGDEVGMLLNAKATLVLIGERPGLSSPDSLGLYLTWDAQVGLTDASRNCISNVRLDGLSYAEAVKKTIYLLKESRRLELSGVNLKDRTTNDEIELTNSEENFLLN
ncbi:ethanolamine ammonia-lyase subunit EutC [Arcobacter sp. F2176]|uniref:ethanolamine ammonia-lyase subunit EutC n=1 Tax=Arcobacter sp. F2176 TaxID=2044511 RepID=UPI00100A2DA8|nr:ethanolamine ammonia-lyase subunit EutC [Arcobacter sp. F2176]RXJ81695.1 ethanolamine ammonia-lyase [Arcobacter sp. F2176]